ncbi:unnamed protein product, partial [Linum tenue]
AEGPSLDVGAVQLLLHHEVVDDWSEESFNYVLCFKPSIINMYYVGFDCIELDRLSYYDLWIVPKYVRWRFE